MEKSLGDRPAAGRTGPAPGKPLRTGAKSPFVGREDELRRLTAALSFAAEGQGGVMFITGQPGIGKTRLAREALALAKGRGFTVLEGRAFPLHADVAYAPFVDAFGPLLRRLSPARRKMLVRDLPSIGRIFEGLQLPAVEPLGDPAVERTRLFEAMARLIERLALEAPLAFLTDDLHRADPASLDLLLYVARCLSDQRVLLLVTCGADALDSSRDLRSLMVSLKRDGLAEEIAISRLGSDATDKLVQGILGGEPPQDLLVLLHARAGGSPLFIETLVTGLVDSGHLCRTDHGWVLDVEGATTLPPSVRELILERLERLTPTGRRVIDLIAIMGDATSHTVLRAASGLEEGILVDAVRCLRATGLIAEGVDGSDVVYSITHPLVQEVAYAELPEMARRRAHVAAIEALESLSQGRPSGMSRLARHYRGAGPEAEPERALAALVDAGERALLLYANEEAARHFEDALAIIREGGGSRRVPSGRGVESPPPTLNPQPSTLSQVLERLGEAWERIGKPGAAIEVWNEALAERKRMGEVLGEARLNRRLAFAEWDCGHVGMANAHLEAGLALLKEGLAGHRPSQELADLYFARYHILVRLGDTAGVGETAKQLLDIAEQLSSPRAEAEANLAAANFSLAQSDVDGSRRHAMHALMVAEQARDLSICCRAHATLAASCVRLGDHHLMRHHAERGLAVARRLGAPSIEVVFHARLAYADFISGAWNESLRHSREAVALARRVGYPRALAHSLAERAMIFALHGDLSEAASCIYEARMAFGSPYGERAVDRAVFGLIDIVETAVALKRGQVGRALDIARSFVPPPAQSGAPSSLTTSFMPMGLTLLAEAQVAGGDPEGALQTTQKIIGLGPSGTTYLDALASRVEGLARQALGQQEAALICLTRAYEKFTSLAMPFEAARCLLQQATAALSRGSARPEIAVRAAEQSLALFERLEGRSHAEHARRLLRSLGISPPEIQRQRLGGVPVTERELEVARLVARGLTNPEIAKRLTLSRFTVKAHLHRLYTRLGIGSRAALTRLVIEAGLLLT